jgi:hypothetical protein
LLPTLSPCQTDLILFHQNRAADKENTFTLKTCYKEMPFFDCSELARNFGKKNWAKRNEEVAVFSLVKIVFNGTLHNTYM